MKKKSFSVIIFLMMSFCAMAQNPIYDASRQYDIVTDADTFYSFSTPKPCIHPERYVFSPGTVLMQEYISSDTVIVYAVAITFENEYSSSQFYDTCTGIKAMLNIPQGRIGGNNLGYDHRMNIIDSVTLYRVHPHFCWFRYADPCGDNKVLLTPCYEFYFDTPDQIDRMSDTFYVGFRWINGRYRFRPVEFGGRYSNTLPGSLYYSSPESGFIGDTAYSLLTGSNEKLHLF